VPDSKTKNTSKVKIITRDDGSVSRPDAILVSAKPHDLVIVCDAKFYTNEIPEKIIAKTLDDMRLRNTTFGILICSQETKSQEFDRMMAEKHSFLSLIKLNKGDS
jgi:hypothetical protein